MKARMLKKWISAALALALTPALAAAQQVEYYHLDALGSVRAVTDANGDIITRHDYDPYGEEWQAPPSTDTRRFTGKERDSETGQDYFGARYYGSKIGRFTTIDPVYTWSENLTDPQRWNRYAYARDNPLRFTDPDGRVVVPAIVAGAYAVFEVGSTIYDAYTAYQTISDPSSTNVAKAVAVGGLVVGVVSVGGGYGTAGKEALTRVDDAARVPNPWGQVGKPDHQATVRRLRDQAQGEFPDHIVHEGTSIRSQTGVNRRPDVWVEDAQTGKVSKVYEAARTNRTGDFVSRERAKAADYQRSNIPAHFEPVKKEP